MPAVFTKPVQISILLHSFVHCVIYSMALIMVPGFRYLTSFAIFLVRHRLCTHPTFAVRIIDRVGTLSISLLISFVNRCLRWYFRCSAIQLYYHAILQSWTQFFKGVRLLSLRLYHSKCFHQCLLT